MNCWDWYESNKAGCFVLFQKIISNNNIKNEEKCSCNIPSRVKHFYIGIWNISEKCHINVSAIFHETYFINLLYVKFAKLFLAQNITKILAYYFSETFRVIFERYSCGLGCEIIYATIILCVSMLLNFCGKTAYLIKRVM